MRQRLARELAMKALYARDVGRGRPQDVLEYLCDQEGVEPDQARAAADLVEGVWTHLASIDRSISAALRKWQFQRLAAVDRNVLRVAVYELEHDGQTRDAVIIDQAVEIAKAYGGGDSGDFVNGVLRQMARDRAAGCTPRG